MKKLTTSLLVLFLGLLPTVVVAQLDFTGEIRPRTEYRHGLKSLYNDANEAAFFTSQRTRLNVNYAETKFRVGVSLQDIRTWGDVSQLNSSDKNKIMLHEAWGEILFRDNFSLKVGRQELVYDDHRILGNVGWAQQARSHDLALFKFKAGEKGKFHAGFAYNQDKEQLITRLYTTGGNYKSMQFAWYHREFEEFKMSLLFLNNGLQYSKMADGAVIDEETRYSQTFGTHLNYKPGKVKFSGSAYYQTGEDVTGRDLKAYLISASMYYPVADNWKGYVGAEIQSGTDTDKQNVNNDNKSFTPIFGTNHKFNGHMDYFYVGNHGNNVGLQDFFAGLNYGKDKVSFSTALHIFASQADLMKGTEKMDSYLGTEIDLSLGYKYSKSLVIKAGYSQMFASESMEVLKGGDKGEANNWGWVMLVFKPNFLSK
ncbi:MAG: alginate export family protein [Marinifilaceae bacterium]